MISLRTYQQQAIHLMREAFKKHKRILLVQPTGSGKTVVFSEMAKLAYKKNKKILIATDRIELFNQNLKAIVRHNINPQIVNAKTKSFFKDAPVSLCMVETLTRRIKQWKDVNYNPDLLIIDESHKGNFFKLLDAFPNARCIGATATPINKKLFFYYTEIINNIDVQELIEQGYLCKCRGFMMQDNFDNVKVVSGEYDEKQLFTHFDKKVLYKGVVEKYKEKCMGEKTLVFNVSIEHAKKMNQEFNDAGIQSHVVTSETAHEERKRIFSAFESGHFPVLNACGIATTGIDIPSIRCVIMNRATKSLVLFLQCMGRGSRPYPGKTHFTCLDFGNNFLEHGLYEEHREWKLEPPKKKKKGVSPVRACPKCGAMLHASARICEYCQYKFPPPVNEPKEGVMVEVKPEIPNDFKGRKISSLSLSELIRLGKTKDVSKPFIWRVVRSRGGDAIDKFGWESGYAPGWAWNQKKELHDCKFKDRVL